LQQNAADIATVIRALAPQAKAVVGMSLGGLTTLALARDHAELVRKLVLVDITPGVNQEKTKQITDFVNGPATFPSFEELLKRTIEFNPTRTVESLRRGILHNALQLDDGSWVWRKQSVVTDEDEAELRKRAGSVRVEHVEEAGHSVQGDTPLELAALIRDFVGL